MHPHLDLNAFLIIRRRRENLGLLCRDVGVTRDYLREDTTYEDSIRREDNKWGGQTGSLDTKCQRANIHDGDLRFDTRKDSAYICLAFLVLGVEKVLP